MLLDWFEGLAGERVLLLALVEWLLVRGSHPKRNISFTVPYRCYQAARSLLEIDPTFLPTMTALPSADQAMVNPSPPSCTVAVQVLFLTSQNLQVPSLLTDANSASLVGFQATLSIAPVCPLNSVLFFTCGFSGFQIRSVRSADPVAMRCPVGFQAMVRMLPWDINGRVVRGCGERTCGSLDLAMLDHGMFALLRERTVR